MASAYTISYGVDGWTGNEVLELTMIILGTIGLFSLLILYDKTNLKKKKKKK